MYMIYMYQRQKSYGSDIQINMNLGREAWRMQKKGTNRGIELYKGGKHYLGVSVGKTTTIYAFDEYFRNKSKLEYNQDNRGQYRYTFDSFEECIDIIGNLL